jgi:hypothetical protein
MLKDLNAKIHQKKTNKKAPLKNDQTQQMHLFF